MTFEDVPPLLTVSGAVLATQRVRVGHITSSDRCRRPVGREKKKKPRCLIFGTRTITGASMRGVANRVLLTGGYMKDFFTFLLVKWCPFLRTQIVSTCLL